MSADRLVDLALVLSAVAFVYFFLVVLGWAVS